MIPSCLVSLYIFQVPIYSLVLHYFNNLIFFLHNVTVYSAATYIGPIQGVQWRYYVSKIAAYNFPAKHRQCFMYALTQSLPIQIHGKVTKQIVFLYNNNNIIKLDMNETYINVYIVIRSFTHQSAEISAFQMNELIIRSFVRTEKTCIYIVYLI